MLVRMLICFVAAFQTATTIARACLQPADALRVGVKSAAPFAMRSERGDRHGISADLRRRVADEFGATSEPVEYDLAGMLDAVEAGDVEAAVFDAPILEHTVSQDADIAVLPVEFEQQDDAIVLPTGSDLRERINAELRRFTGTDERGAIVDRCLGR